MLLEDYTDYINDMFIQMCLDNIYHYRDHTVDALAIIE